MASIQNPVQAVLSEAAAPHKIVGTKVSEAEFAALEERARASRKLTLSEWVRAELLEPDDGAARARSCWPRFWPCGRS